MKMKNGKKNELPLCRSGKLKGSFKRNHIQNSFLDKPFSGKNLVDFSFINVHNILDVADLYCLTSQ